MSIGEAMRFTTYFSWEGKNSYTLPNVPYPNNLPIYLVLLRFGKKLSNYYNSFSNSIIFGSLLIGLNSYYSLGFANFYF